MQATFDDELREEAVAKKHSLTCEAVACGRDAGAYRTILTHFSQVRPRLPILTPSPMIPMIHWEDKAPYDINLCECRMLCLLCCAVAVA